jgi:menaquinone-dependent protoporphyrinogen oxidase
MLDETDRGRETAMTGRILVAYATKHGSTQEVAEAIAASLREQGLDVDVERAENVHDMTGYVGVVLGGALYMGRLHEHALRFLRRYRTSFDTVPLALFGMGPRTLEASDVLRSGAQLQAGLSKAPGVTPIAAAVFGGVIDPEKLHFPFSRMPASDARDWDAIEAWARKVGAAFGARPAVAMTR